MDRSDFAIKKEDYARIFSVIHSVYRSQDKRPGASCLFYNFVGALLLNEFFGINAKPVMGAAFFHVGNISNPVMSFGLIDEHTGICKSSNDAFHCWIETDNHIIDFTAPVYDEYLTRFGIFADIPRKSFQKKSVLMMKSCFDLSHQGDFFVQADVALTKSLFQDGLQSNQVMDFANICRHWFVRAPKPMKDSIVITDDLGKITVIHEVPLQISGYW